MVPETRTFISQFRRRKPRSQKKKSSPNWVLWPKEHVPKIENWSEQAKKATESREPKKHGLKIENFSVLIQFLTKKEIITECQDLKNMI